PNVNTLIIEDANRLGLSQLHQIRGRVGRSSRKAYAYLTYRPDTILTEVAEKRLQAIQEFTEFGSGFKIALRDLQLRGAGSILGAEQSGQMETIGYDLYVKILEDAVNLEKGLEPKAERNCRIDLPVDAFIPESYVTSQKLRMDIYKRIGESENLSDAEDVASELRDRFGPIPKEAETLLRVSLLRHLAMDLGFESIEKKESTVCFFHPSLDESACVSAAKAPELRGRLMFAFGGRSHAALRIQNGSDLLGDAETFLQLYKKRIQNQG
ncbi:MAG: transcription-repair coupling factor, partial [Clostridia bacterium]|nr:transcription-repair coupling factor [Clostridia bacterium]